MAASGVQYIEAGGWLPGHVSPASETFRAGRSAFTGAHSAAIGRAGLKDRIGAVTGSSGGITAPDKPNEECRSHGDDTESDFSGHSRSEQVKLAVSSGSGS